MHAQSYRTMACDMHAQWTRKLTQFHNPVVVVVVGTAARLLACARTTHSTRHLLLLIKRMS